MQQLNADIGTITAWLEKTEAELAALRLAKPPSDIQEIALRVKRLQVSGRELGRWGGGEGERKSEQAQSVCLVVVVVPNKQVRPGFGVAGSMRVMCV